MKLCIALVGLALVACKSKSSNTTATSGPTPCASVAVRLTEALRADMGEVLAEEDWPKVTAVLDERCTEDAWAPETIACMQSAAQEEEVDACAEQLTDAQSEAVKAQFEATIQPMIKEGSMKPKMESDGGMEERSRELPAASAPAPTPPPPDDPCGGDD